VKFLLSYLRNPFARDFLTWTGKPLLNMLNP
jgi:hypothetical protein